MFHTTRNLILEKKNTHTSPVILPSSILSDVTNYPVVLWSTYAMALIHGAYIHGPIFRSRLRRLDSRVYASVFGNSVVDGVRTMDEYR